MTTFKKAVTEQMLEQARNEAVEQVTKQFASAKI